jgi:hypothetical protein
MVTGFPSSTISPALGKRMPAMMFISVDFPAPFSPQVRGFRALKLKQHR